MALTSSSTLTDALAQYNDNLSWEGNSGKATLALEAIRWLLINRPQTTGAEIANVNFESLETEKARLENFVGTVGTTERASFTRGRMLT